MLNYIGDGYDVLMCELFWCYGVLIDEWCIVCVYFVVIL